MTQQQISWAATHDWFLGTDGRGVWVEDCEHNKRRGQVCCIPRYFDNIYELRRWAGY
ncbi:hypothetical protein V5F50_19655 [Xanthobacter sp. V13C-7B]|uniref:hypothetical protein n=1 Tax=Xanthobacter variabilis TaxID=3119932 RepID=UPI00372B53C5